MTPIQKRLAQALEPIISTLDDQAKEIVTDLTKRLKPFHRMTETHSDILSARVFYALHGQIMSFVKQSTLDEINESAISLGHSQFRTHDENQIYCGGTKNLLELLTQYRSLRTEKALVMATPDARISGGPEGGPHQAFINVNHLRTHYGKDRAVTIVVASQEGYIMFKFEEIAVLGKLPPWLMADETVEEL